jgi:hypothetical protein
MVGTDGSDRAFIIHKGMGLVREVYSDDGLNEFDGARGSNDAHILSVCACRL